MPETARPDDAPDLGTAAARGIRWVGAARVVGEIAAFGSIVVTARLVAPADFGRAAIALIVYQLAQGLGTQGIGTPLVQKKELDPRDPAAALMLSIVTGLIGTALAVLFAVFVGPLAFDDATVKLLVIVAPSFLLVSILGVPMGMLQRRLDFRVLSLIDALASMAGAAVSVALAAAGLNGTAIVLGSMAVSLTALLAMLIAVRLPKPLWDRPAMRGLAGVGVPATASGLINFATRNVDNAIVGVRLGPTPLGYYSRAFRLGAEYQSKVSIIMTTLALPLFSRTSDVAELRRIRGRMVRVHALVLFPPIFLLMALAPVLVPFMFGDQWDAAITPTQILAGSGLATVILTGTSPLMLALGRPDALIRWSLGTFAAFALAVYFAAPHGIVWVAAAGSAVQFGMVIAAQYFLIQPIAGASARETLVDDLLPTTLACVPLVILAFAGTALLQDAHVAPLPIIAAVSAAGLAAFAITLHHFFPASWWELTDFLERIGVMRLLRKLTTRLRRRDHGVPSWLADEANTPVPRYPPRSSEAGQDAPESLVDSRSSEQ